MTDQTPAPNSPSIKKKILSWLPYIALPLMVYFGNVEIQSYLGSKALEEVALPKLGLEEAMAQAKHEDKLVLADMSAIWCPSCRKLDKEVLAKQTVQEAINKRYVFSRIEYESDEGAAFMQKYDVSGFPTLLVLDADGNQLKKLPLTFSPETFIGYLQHF